MNVESAQSAEPKKKTAKQIAKEKEEKEKNQRELEAVCAHTLSPHVNLAGCKQGEREADGSRAACTQGRPGDVRLSVHPSTCLTHARQGPEDVRPGDG